MSVHDQGTTHVRIGVNPLVLAPVALAGCETRDLMMDLGDADAGSLQIEATVRDGTGKTFSELTGSCEFIQPPSVRL